MCLKKLNIYRRTNFLYNKNGGDAMFVICLLIFIGICIYHACEPTIPAEYHRNWRLEQEDLERVYQGKMTQKQFEKNIRNGKYR